jgi:molybdenum cofactor cytidylyltransferase
MRLSPRVGCVVLAAGEGSRFDLKRAKLLLPLDGVSLVQRAIDNASRSYAASCTLVVGARAEAILLKVDPRRCAVVRNARWKDGLSGSIRVGLSLHEDDDACILAVADRPFVTADDLNQLIERYAGHRNAIVALRAGTTWGSPVLFPRSDFSKLANLKGDEGAKRYAAAQKERLEFVDAVHADAFADIDTQQDYQRIRR